MDESWLVVIRSASVCGAFSGWFSEPACPASNQQWPECHCSRNNEDTEPPRTVRGMRVNALYSDESKRNGEYETARQVCPKENQKRCCYHSDPILAPFPLAWGSGEVSGWCSNLNSALSE